MRSAEKVCFAQVDGHLDSNPKVVKAGSVHATAIFQFLLRRVALANSNGVVPISFIDPEYLERTLFMSCDDARHGTSRAVTAKLIAIDEGAGLVYIVGWTDEWGRKAKVGAERTKSWRERNRLKSPGLLVTNGDEARRTVTVSDESDAYREEKKREEKESGPAKADPALQLAEAATGEINRLSGSSYQASSADTIKSCRALSKEKYTPDQAIRVVQSKRAWLDDAKMREHFKPKTLLRPSNFRSYWDDIASAATSRKLRSVAPADDSPDMTNAIGIGLVKP